MKPDQRLALDEPPVGWELDRPPDGLWRVGDDGAADVIVAFFTEAAQLPAHRPGLASRIYPSGALWVACPRRAGGHTSDITDSVIRAETLPIGIVDVKVAAIDEDWSGQRSYGEWRSEPAPGETLGPVRRVAVRPE